MPISRIRQPKKSRGLKRALLLAPILGAVAYLAYSKLLKSKGPALVEDWGWPEPREPVTADRASAPGTRVPAAAPTNGAAATRPSAPRSVLTAQQDEIPRPARSDSFAIADQATSLIGKAIVDLNGEEVGSVEGVYYRSLSGDPEWLATSPGLADKKRVLVPLAGATVGDQVSLAQAKAEVEAAPEIESLTLDEVTEMALYGHYGVRRVLPGVEAERNDENIVLRQWLAPEPAEMRED